MNVYIQSGVINARFPRFLVRILKRSVRSRNVLAIESNRLFAWIRYQSGPSSLGWIRVWGSVTV